MNELISVIVPVYNVEKYLERCIRSILDQTYEKFELLLIDDGSPDSSIEICRKYEEQDSRIRVFCKENGGLSSARNYGLDHCNGDYITFVDSDDYIANDYLLNLLLALKTGNYDIVQCKYQVVSSNHTYLNCKVPFDERDICQISKEEALNGRKYKVASWLCIYKRSLFENNRYSEGIINEDDDIYYRLAYAAASIAILNNKLYFYCLSPNSIMRSSKDKELDFIDIYQRRIDFFRQRNEQEFVYGSYIRFCIVLMLTYSSSLVNGNNKGDRKNFLDLFNKYYSLVIKVPYVGVKDKLIFGCFHTAPLIVGWFVGKMRS